MRDEIQHLAHRMEAKLHLNSIKQESWKQMTLDDLCTRLLEEAQEVHQALYNNDGSQESLLRIQNEVADVANFCMFLHDNVAREREALKARDWEPKHD